MTIQIVIHPDNSVIISIIYRIIKADENSWAVVLLRVAIFFSIIKIFSHLARNHWCKTLDHI